jgi:hypothetical protein
VGFDPLSSLRSRFRTDCNADDGRPLIPIAALGFAAAIWLIGACCRYLFGSSEIRDPVRRM